MRQSPHHGPVLTIIDTYGRAFSGDEKSKKDVQPSLNAIEQLCEDHSTSALLVHHAGKDQKGPNQPSLRILSHRRLDPVDPPSCRPMSRGPQTAARQP